MSLTQSQLRSPHPPSSPTTPLPISPNSHPKLPPRIAAALDAMREGRPVVLQDDDDRENEADLIVAAEKLTDATMALLIRECSGIVCLCLPDDKCARSNCRRWPPPTAAATARRSRCRSKRAKA